MQGTLKKMNQDRGFAFVQAGSDSYFLHARSVDPMSPVIFQNACIGDLVDFAVDGGDPKGPQATDAMITERPVGEVHRGVLRSWNARGFGFVKAEDGHEHFCHATVCQGFVPGDDSVGMAVEFELFQGDGGKSACVNVRKVE